MRYALLLFPDSYSFSDASLQKLTNFKNEDAFKKKNQDFCKNLGSS